MYYRLVCSSFAATQPIGMTHIQSINISAECSSLEHYENTFYVGRFGGVDAIRRGVLTSLIHLDGAVHCVRFHKQLLYLLHSYGRTRSMKVYHIDGNFIRSWDVQESYGFSKFSIHCNTVCFPNKKKKIIQLHSLTGEHLGRDIPFDGDENRSVCLCSTPDGNLILTQRAKSLVACFDFETGAQLWKIADVEAPVGIAFDNFNHVLVYEKGSSIGISLKVLNPLTG